MDSRCPKSHVYGHRGWMGCELWRKTAVSSQMPIRVYAARHEKPRLRASLRGVRWGRADQQASRLIGLLDHIFLDPGTLATVFRSGSRGQPSDPSSRSSEMRFRRERCVSADSGRQAPCRRVLSRASTAERGVSSGPTSLVGRTNSWSLSSPDERLAAG